MPRLALPFASWGTLDKFLNLPVTQFPQLYNKGTEYRVPSALMCYVLSLSCILPKVLQPRYMRD